MSWVGLRIVLPKALLSVKSEWRVKSEWKEWEDRYTEIPFVDVGAVSITGTIISGSKSTSKACTYKITKPQHNLSIFA